MIRSTLALVLAVASAGAAAQTQVGVSVQINQPGFYGRIDLGGLPPAAPPPVLVYPQPVVIVPGPVAVQQRPIYLHVPPGHEKHWDKHCAEYRACGQPVYFVRDDWYRDHAVRHDVHEAHEDHAHGRGHGHDDEHGRGHGRD
jgi:hypothetical protein